ncbi:hypothetical protein VPH35_137970 [Triticum aestivum]
MAIVDTRFYTLLSKRNGSIGSGVLDGTLDGCNLQVSSGSSSLRHQAHSTVNEEKRVTPHYLYLTRHAPPLPLFCSALPPRRPSILLRRAVAPRLRDGPAGPARRSPTRFPPVCRVGRRGRAAAARSSGCPRQHHEQVNEIMSSI